MNTLKEILSLPPRKLLGLAISNPGLRKVALDSVKKIIYKNLIATSERHTKPIREAQYQAIVNMLLAIDRAFAEDLISKSVKDRLLKIFIGKIVMRDEKVIKNFCAKYNSGPPGFLVISPVKQCNLKCAGCYAASVISSNEQLDYKIVDRIISEKTKLWDSYFTVISGGEPFLWNFNGKTILDLFSKHNDNYFLMYTNGTLINKAVAERMAEIGNVTPAISVEGFEEQTDKIRGKGIFKKILQAMENLRAAGVPFGISVTATKENAELLMSDEFIDFFFNKRKALYGWLFQYMPIGRALTLDRMVTPEQRKWMLEREQNIIFEKQLPYFDFWNGGLYASGCIAGARSGGYFYIEWNGNITPCVFFPYSIGNIKEIYNRGGNLNDVINSPLFKKIREFRSNYGYNKIGSVIGNWFAPCPIRDHYDFAYRAIKETKAYPIDETANVAINDPLYYQGLVSYGKIYQELTAEKWRNLFLENNNIWKNKFKERRKNV